MLVSQKFVLSIILKESNEILSKSDSLCFSIVTEPYLKIFRKRIPPVGGFDISAIPAIFILDLVGQATAALGAGFPTDSDRLQHQMRLVKKQEAMMHKNRENLV